MVMYLLHLTVRSYVDIGYILCVLFIGRILDFDVGIGPVVLYLFQIMSL